MSAEPVLGVVVPTLNESGELPSLLDDLARLSFPHRVVVVDGGSVDGTRALARSRGVEVHTARRGRGFQLNAGAAVLDTPWLLFLHADVRLPHDARRALEDWLPGADPDEVAFFRLRHGGDHWFYRLAEKIQRLRERVSGLVYGDQGLLIHRDLFDAVGGYPPLPLMEDVEIMRRIRRRGRPVRLPAEMVASPRRYEREGRWLGWARNGVLLGLHLLGVPARILARWYRPEPGNHRTLLVFAKAPIEGRVKTRLARDVGHERATRLYRRIGRRVVDQIRGGPYETVVCYDPPAARESVRSWLGEEGLTFRPQKGPDLGTRMAEAFDWAFGRSLDGPDGGQREVCIVGTDAPGVEQGVVTEAFRSLEEADLVLGPASDGGYYLLALSEPRPELFREIEWSTPEVLDATLQRAESLGLRVRLLEERTDLDTSEDLARLGLVES
ncbi:MAG: TIGR04283 family arsenosugar biosynthesis glycosyltransferase [Longimicrobiales bacterium]|nr:TIGR04283 family arsenosugar biosynthesis glycosyltransferase [Longimicrobiales bacterium]